MNHSHPPLEIDPNELTPGNVLISLNAGQDEPTQIQTHQFVINANNRSDDKKGQASPIELVLSGLGLSLAQILDLAIKKEAIHVDNIHVALSYQNNTSDKNKPTTAITREVIIDGHIETKERELIQKAIALCPMQKILQGNFTIDTILI